MMKMDTSIIENLEGNIKNSNIKAGYIFFSELSAVEKKIVLDAGYDENDLVGRISKNDTLAKRENIMKLIDYRR